MGNRMEPMGLVVEGASPYLATSSRGGTALAAMNVLVSARFGRHFGEYHEALVQAARVCRNLLEAPERCLRLHLEAMVRLDVSELQGPDSRLAAAMTAAVRRLAADELLARTPEGRPS